MPVDEVQRNEVKDVQEAVGEVGKSLALCGLCFGSRVSDCRVNGR